MILWFALTVMTAIAAVFVSAPFIRRLERRRLESASDVAIYRDQLREVDHEAALGLIDTAQAETARTEIKRRLLAAGETTDAVLPALSSGERTFAAIGVASVVVFGSIGLFALTANVEQLSDAPVAAIEPPVRNPAAAPTVAAVAAGAPPALPNAAPASGVGKAPRARTPLPPVEEMIQRLVTRLQRNPKDVEGWRMLGWSYSSTEHFTEAAAAYARAIELNPDSADFRDARVEALIRAAKGVVTPDAKSANEETLKVHPKDARARYIGGLTREQAGDKAAAQEEWNALLGELDKNDPYAQEIRQRVADGKGFESTRAEPPPGRANGDAAVAVNAEATAPDAPEADRGPRQEDIGNAEAMAPDDRQAMIQRMVDSLASRLERSPNDADGWIKLIRSRSVLGDRDKAKLAVEKALKVFADETAEHKRITATVEELGLNK